MSLYLLEQQGFYEIVGYGGSSWYWTIGTHTKTIKESFFLLERVLLRQEELYCGFEELLSKYSVVKEFERMSYKNFINKYPEVLI